MALHIARPEHAGKGVRFTEDAATAVNIGVVGAMNEQSTTNFERLDIHFFYRNYTHQGEPKRVDRMVRIAKATFNRVIRRVKA